MMNNVQLLKEAQKFKGQGGSVFRKFAGLPSGAAWCCAYVCYIFKLGKDAALFYGGKVVTYCPTAIRWCQANLAQIPIYLAMPMDIIFFDWEPNGVPNHIGFVRKRKSDQDVYTIEGNTSGGIVAEKIRPNKYVCGCFRPHFKATYDISKPLEIDGQFDYSSIAMLQKALGIKIDGILGRGTVKALQKKAGVTQDGSWGPKTSRAVQKLVGTTVDGAFGMKSVKALQKWINSQVKISSANTQKPAQNANPAPAEPSVDSSKLSVDGSIGAKTIKRMQEFFGTMQDGIISGQKESLYKYYPSFEKSALRFCDGGSACIMALQRWLGITQDGVLGENTARAWQRKLGVKADGCFGTASAKAWQKYLNENDEAIYPKSVLADKIVAKAKDYAWPYGTSSKIWDYDTGYARSSYKKALKEFMNYTSKVAQSDCGYFLDTIARSLGYEKFLILEGAKEPFPSLPDDFGIVLKGKKVPDGFLQKGDFVRYKKKNGSQHTYGVLSDNYIFEAGRKTRFPVIRKMDANSKCNASGVKHSTIEVIRAQ